MVSRQERRTLYSRKRDFTTYGEEFNNSFKKSKQEDQSQSKLKRTMFSEQPNSESMRSTITFDFQLLHHHTPLPSDWQAKGCSRKSEEDDKTYLKDQVIVGRQPKISLDLELNLSPSYSSPSKATTKIDETSNQNETVTSSDGKSLTNSSKKSISGTGLSWLAFEGGDDDEKEQEMVTKVCMKCHMLVMLCTSTPVCPNCKFMHPRDHNSTQLFKEESNLLRLLC